MSIEEAIVRYEMTPWWRFGRRTYLLTIILQALAAAIERETEGPEAEGPEEVTVPPTGADSHNQVSHQDNWTSEDNSWATPARAFTKGEIGFKPNA